MNTKNQLFFLWMITMIAITTIIPSEEMKFTTNNVIWVFAWFIYGSLFMNSLKN